MAERKKVTMQDIADRVGVSKMTVSAVLGHSSHVRVSEATRERVLEAVRQMHYRPHAVARSLRRRCTNVIGLYNGYGYLDARNPFLSEIIGGLQEGCDLHRKDLLLHGVFRGCLVEDIYAELVDGRIDGLIINASPDDPLVGMLAESPLPVVGVVDAIPGIPSVVVDDEYGMRLLVDHLIRKGHRRILFRGWTRSAVSVNRRRMALYAAASTHNLQISEWIAPEKTDPTDRSVASWLDAPPDERPTAAVCLNDLTAYDLLAHCRTHGVRVPDDLAITGFDGIPTGPGQTGFLTTIRAPWPEVARTAVNLLLDRLNGKEIPQETILPVEFVQGITA